MMAKKEKKPVHHVQMTEGKRQIIQQLLQEYDIESAQDIQDALKDLLGGTIKEMMEAEMDDVYPVLYIDAIHYSVRDNGIIRKLAAYVILGINTEGRKEVLTIEVGDNESSKYWLAVLNTLKNRGVQDILIICADGLTGIKEAIQTAFPKTEYQRCIVHQVRNTLKYVADKDRKPFATDLKTIYHAPDEKKGLEARERVTAKWSEKYPMAMRCTKDGYRNDQSRYYRVSHCARFRNTPFISTCLTAGLRPCIVREPRTMAVVLGSTINRSQKI